MEEKRVHFFQLLLVFIIGMVALYYTALPLIHKGSALAEETIETLEARVEEHNTNYELSQSSKNLDQLSVYAHRGIDANAQDNTFAAYDAAVACGCPQIELDIRTSKDGVFYVMHDETLWNAAGKDVKLSSLTSAELDQISLKNGEKVHRLSEVFDRYEDQMLYLIEFKEKDADTDAFYRLIRQYSDLADHIQVQSFYPNVLEEVHEKLPNVYEQLLINRSADIDKAEDMDYIDGLALESNYVTEDRIDEIHEAGKEVSVWTVDSEAQLKQYLSWGADSVITDLPDAVQVAESVTNQNENS